MNRIYPFYLLSWLFLISCHSQPAAPTVSMSLFAQIGQDESAVNQKLQATFDQIFFGSPADEALYYESGSNQDGALGYILDVHNDDIRSEGMSYGMMIAVQMNRKDVFDALWNYAKSYMYHADPTHPAFGYFGWSVNREGKFNDEMPAPDGEEYFATALYFASKRWGDGTGIYHYKKEADCLLTDMIARQPIRKTIKGRVVTGLSLFDLDHHMVRFTTDSSNAFHTDASYHLPAFYEVWALVGPTRDSLFWKEAAQVSRAYFESAAHPVTGLTPDYGNFDGTPWSASWRPESSTFSYDAWRTAMNWSVDWHWWKKDSSAIERSNRLLGFFKSQGSPKYVNQYTLDGQRRADNLSVGLIACNATAALAADMESRLDFVQDLWDAEIPRGEYRYYDGMLLMMALLHCADEFKVYI